MADEDPDEGIVDNWEDADTEELERRMEERQKQLEVETRKVSTTKAKIAEDSAKPIELQTQLPLRIQDSERTEYVAPIKILKRQADLDPRAGGDPSTTASSTTQKQHKSLAEREAEYASARARILGSPYTAEEQSPSSSQRRVVIRGSENSLPSESVKRQPKGPNGSHGFQSKK